LGVAFATQYQARVWLSFCGVHIFHVSDLRKSRPNKRNWESHLTSDERREIAELEKKIRKLDQQSSILRGRRQRIQNRATARAAN
jgi:hypothetical protein